jgi:hypothetical protein
MGQRLARRVRVMYLKAVLRQVLQSYCLCAGLLPAGLAMSAPVAPGWRI